MSCAEGRLNSCARVKVCSCFRVLLLRGRGITRKMFPTGKTWMQSRFVNVNLYLNRTVEAKQSSNPSYDAAQDCPWGGGGRCLAPGHAGKVVVFPWFLYLIVTMGTLMQLLRSACCFFVPFLHQDNRFWSVCEWSLVWILSSWFHIKSIRMMSY